MDQLPQELLQVTDLNINQIAAAMPSEPGDIFERTFCFDLMQAPAQIAAYLLIFANWCQDHGYRIGAYRIEDPIRQMENGEEITIANPLHNKVQFLFIKKGRALPTMAGPPA